MSIKRLIQETPSFQEFGFHKLQLWSFSAVPTCSTYFGRAFFEKDEKKAVELLERCARIGQKDIQSGEYARNTPMIVQDVYNILNANWLNNKSGLSFDYCMSIVTSGFESFELTFAKVETGEEAKRYTFIKSLEKKHNDTCLQYFDIMRDGHRTCRLDHIVNIIPMPYAEAKHKAEAQRASLNEESKVNAA